MTTPQHTTSERSDGTAVAFEACAVTGAFTWRWLWAWPTAGAARS